MVLKKGPESHSGPSGARREFLRTFSIILGLLYIFTGLCVSGITGIRYSYRGMPPDERISWFHYRNGTPLFPDQGTMGLFSFLSFATVFLLVTAGFMILVLVRKYLQGNDGYSVRDREDSNLNRIPSRVFANECRIVLISAWLACITITGIFVIGFPVSDGIWFFMAVWILAIIQTFYVRSMHQEYTRGK